MDKEIKNIVAKMTTREKAEFCVDCSALCIKAFPQYNIPGMVTTDGTSGVRFFTEPAGDPKQKTFKDSINASFDTQDALSKTEPATCFPAGSSLACSWDTELAEKIGHAIADECKRLGIGLLLGPGLNTRRSPLDGRGFEYYSEDPVLSGEMASGMVNGLQKNGVGACVKHFACNNSDYMRTIYDNTIDIRALREVFLAGFERVVKKAKPASIMASYNLINGVQSCENEWLLTDVLRNEWKFRGVVMSDCGAIKNHVRSFAAGIDYEMGHSITAIDKLVSAVENKELDESVLDRHCERLLDLVRQYSQDGKEPAAVDFSAHHKLAQDAAAQCAVLLKNDNDLLPLSADSSIAVIGSWAKNPVFQGTGCAIVHQQQEDIPLEYITSLCSHVTYADGYDDVNTVNEALIDEAVQAAKGKDAVIIFAGAKLPPESDDYNRHNLNIEAAQSELIESVSRVNQHVIVVLMNCESVVMPWIDNVQSVLDMWYCGEGCGSAVAGLLFGKENPSGKLPVTMPGRLCDCCDYLHFPGENHKQLYGEGIYVGYRYFDKKEIDPLFPFGFGLSYTTFEYSDIKFVKDSIVLPEEAIVSCKVTNSGRISGAEVIQLYVSDKHSRLHRPVRELKAFQKVFLQPGETKEILFSLDKRCFEYFDPAFSKWVADTGEFIIEIGSSSRDIRLSGSIKIVSSEKNIPTFHNDSHYIELFQNQKAKKIFFETIVEWGLVDKDELSPELEKNFYNSFWGIAQHLDLVAPYEVTEKMVDDLIRKINAGLE